MAAEKSAVEKLSGALTTGVLMTAVGVVSGNPLAAFLPLLAATPAARRHKDRIEKSLTELHERLLPLESQLATLTDAQFQYVGELAGSIIRSTNEKKIEVLKHAIERGVASAEPIERFGTQLARLLRDITPEEAAFLLEHEKYKEILIDFDAKNESGVVTVKRGTPDYELLGGLLTLGLLHYSQHRLQVDAYYFSDIARSLVEVLK